MNNTYDKELVMKLMEEMLEQDAEQLKDKLSDDFDYTRLFLEEPYKFELLYDLINNTYAHLDRACYEVERNKTWAERRTWLEKELKKWQYRLPVWRTKKKTLKAELDKISEKQEDVWRKVASPSDPPWIRNIDMMTSFFVKALELDDPEDALASEISYDIRKFYDKRLEKIYSTLH